MNNLNNGNVDLPSGYLAEAWNQEAAATARPIPETWMLQAEASGLNYDGWMLGEMLGEKTLSTQEVRRRDAANWSVYDTWMPEVVAGSSPEKNPGIDSIKKKRKGTPWTEHEHRQFLKGLVEYGKGDWKSISRFAVRTRTPTQVASHAQKFFLRLLSSKKERKRSSIHDINTIDGFNFSNSNGENQQNPQEPINVQDQVLLRQKGQVMDTPPDNFFLPGSGKFSDQQTQDFMYTTSDYPDQQYFQQIQGMQCPTNNPNDNKVEQTQLGNGGLLLGYHNDYYLDQQLAQGVGIGYQTSYPQIKSAQEAGLGIPTDQCQVFTQQGGGGGRGGYPTDQCQAFTQQGGGEGRGGYPTDYSDYSDILTELQALSSNDYRAFVLGGGGGGREVSRYLPPFFSR